jgi:hypothetical protein
MSRCSTGFDDDSRLPETRLGVLTGVSPSYGMHLMEEPSI